MAIYLIAKSIQMQTNDFSNLILRIGSFHLQKVWLHCIGQYLEGSGIESILTEDAEVYGVNTLQSIMKGNQYNRGVRAHKLLLEAITFIQYYEYIKCAQTSELQVIYGSSMFQNLREALVDKDYSKFSTAYTELRNNLEHVNFFKNFDEYVNDRCANDETFMYFNNYCEMVKSDK